VTCDESQRLKVLAYRFWEQEGRPEGRAEEHWKQAQRQLELEFRIGCPDEPAPEATHTVARGAEIPAVSSNALTSTGA
jgi:hypothetical protein